MYKCFLVSTNGSGSCAENKELLLQSPRKAYDFEVCEDGAGKRKFEVRKRSLLRKTLPLDAFLLQVFRDRNNIVVELAKLLLLSCCCCSSPTKNLLYNQQKLLLWEAFVVVVGATQCLNCCGSKF